MGRQPSAEPDGEKFYLETYADGTDREFRVSTIQLRASLYAGMNFETCLFWDDGSRVVDRYETEDAAEDAHGRIVEAIKAGEYNFSDPDGGLASFEVA